MRLLTYRTAPIRRLVFLAGVFCMAWSVLAEWESMEFELPSGCRESRWRDALTAKIGGAKEVQTKVGRVDVATSNEVYELDWPHNWKAGMGQVLAYAGETGKRPVLVLIAYSQGPENLQLKTKILFDQADQECRRHGIRLLILFPSKPETFPHSTTNRSLAAPKQGTVVHDLLSE